MLDIVSIKKEIEAHIPAEDLPAIYFDGGLDNLLECVYILGSLETLREEIEKLEKPPIPAGFDLIAIPTRNFRPDRNNCNN